MVVRGRWALTLALTLTVTPTLTVTLTRYEGGGLYRHVHLVRASPVHVEQDGLFAYSYLFWGSGCDVSFWGGGGSGDDCAGPLSATVRASATLLNAGSGAATVCVSFTLIGPDGAVAATASAPTLTRRRPRVSHARVRAARACTASWSL